MSFKSLSFRPSLLGCLCAAAFSTPARTQDMSRNSLAPSAATDGASQVVITADDDGYSVPTSTTATRLETPRCGRRSKT